MFQRGCFPKFAFGDFFSIIISTARSIYFVEKVTKASYNFVEFWRNCS